MEGLAILALGAFTRERLFVRRSMIWNVRESKQIGRAHV